MNAAAFLILCRGFVVLALTWTNPRKCTNDPQALPSSECTRPRGAATSDAPKLSVFARFTLNDTSGRSHIAAPGTGALREKRPFRRDQKLGCALGWETDYKSSHK